MSLIIDNGNQIFNKTNTLVYLDYSKKTNIYVGSPPTQTMTYFPKNSLNGALRNNAVFSNKYGYERLRNINKSSRSVYLNEISNENATVFFDGKLLPKYTENNDYVPTFYPASNNKFIMNLDIYMRSEYPQSGDIVILNQSNLLRYERHADLNQNDFNLSSIGSFTANSLLFVDGKNVPREVAGVINWEVVGSTLNTLTFDASRKHIVLIDGLAERANNGFYISTNNYITLDADINYTNALVFANGEILDFDRYDIIDGKIFVKMYSQGPIEISICKRKDIQEYNMYPSISVINGKIYYDNNPSYFTDSTLIQVKEENSEIISSNKISDIKDGQILCDRKFVECQYGDYCHYTTSYFNPTSSIQYDENGNFILDEINRYRAIILESIGSYAIEDAGKITVMEKGDTYYLDGNPIYIYKNISRFATTFDKDYPFVNIDGRQIMSVMLNGRPTENYQISGDKMMVTFDTEYVKTRYNIVVITTAQVVEETDSILFTYNGHEYFDPKYLNNCTLINNIVSFSDAPISEYANVSPISSINSINKIQTGCGGAISMQTFDMSSDAIEALEFNEGRLIVVNADNKYRIYVSCKSNLSNSSIEIENNAYSYVIDYANVTNWRSI